MPSLVATPRVMLWCTMSAPCRSRRSASSRPAGCFRSMATSRLPRWQPTNGVPDQRILSPASGSILITSAPRSPTTIGPNGPARYCPKSSSRIPARRPARYRRRRVGAGAAGDRDRRAVRARTSSVCAPTAGLRPDDRTRRAEQVDRHAHLGGRPDDGVDHRRRRAVGDRLRVVEHVGGRGDGVDRVPVGAAARRPSRRGHVSRSRARRGRRRSAPGRARAARPGS